MKSFINTWKHAVCKILKRLTIWLWHLKVFRHSSSKKKSKVIFVYKFVDQTMDHHLVNNRWMVFTSQLVLSELCGLVSKFVVVVCQHTISANLYTTNTKRAICTFFPYRTNVSKCVMPLFFRFLSNIMCKKIPLLQLPTSTTYTTHFFKVQKN